MEQGLPLARGSDDPAILGSLLGDLGHVSLVLGDHRRARELLGEALAVQRAHGDRAWIAWCLAAWPASWLPRSLSGQRSCLERRPHCEDVGAPLRPSVQTVYAPIVDQARMALGEVAFAAAWERGNAWSLEEAIAEALAVVNEPAETTTTSVEIAPASGLTSRVGGVATRGGQGAPMARSPRCCSSACPPSSVT